MNNADKVEIEKIKTRIFKALPEGVDILLVIIALAEMITDFTKLTYGIQDEAQ